MCVKFGHDRLKNLEGAEGVENRGRYMGKKTSNEIINAGIN